MTLHIRGHSELLLPFEIEEYDFNKALAWARLYGGPCPGYFRDFGWRAVFMGGGCE